MAIASIPGNLPRPEPVSSAPFNPLSILAGPAGGGIPLPSLQGGNASSDTGPQSGTFLNNIPVNSPFQVGDGNTQGGLDSNPTASASAQQQRPQNNDLVTIAAIVAAGVVALGVLR